jgi:hypothetical protein
LRRVAGSFLRLSIGAKYKRFSYNTFARLAHPISDWQHAFGMMIAYVSGRYIFPVRALKLEQPGRSRCAHMQGQSKVFLLLRGDAR